MNICKVGILVFLRLRRSLNLTKIGGTMYSADTTIRQYDNTATRGDMLRHG